MLQRWYCRLTESNFSMHLQQDDPASKKVLGEYYFNVIILYTYSRGTCSHSSLWYCLHAISWHCLLQYCTFSVEWGERRVLNQSLLPGIHKQYLEASWTLVFGSLQAARLVTLANVHFSCFQVSARLRFQFTKEKLTSNYLAQKFMSSFLKEKYCAI